jgi:hemolysin III
MVLLGIVVTRSFLHLWPHLSYINMRTPASRILQILDHVGIYLVIAGTYTPFLLIGMHHHTSARVLLTAEWTAAILGSVFASKYCTGIVMIINASILPDEVALV